MSLKLQKIKNEICYNCGKPISYIDMENSLYMRVEGEKYIHWNCDDATPGEAYIYRLVDLEKDEVLATTDEKDKIKLSIKSCQEIESGYDFDNFTSEGLIYTANESFLKPEKFSEKEIGLLHGFIDGAEFGFQKALEILGDKKFSEEDVKKAILNTLEMTPYQVEQFRKDNSYHISSNIIQSLQKNEWDVEVEMEDSFKKTNEKYIDDICWGSYYEHSKKPKLDSNGCLILKKK
jgi:starvation-inducible outer membrane lipoprotein